MKRKEQKQLTRERLFNTSIGLFIQNGYDHVTVDDIVSKAGVSKGSFYHHFISKSAILLDYGNMIHNELLDRLRLAMGKPAEACADKITLFFAVLNEFNVQNMQGLQLLFKHTSSVPTQESGISSIAIELTLILSMQIDFGKIANQVTSKMESIRLAEYMIQIYYHELRQNMKEYTPSEFPDKLRQTIETMLQLFFKGFIK